MTQTPEHRQRARTSRGLSLTLLNAGGWVALWYGMKAGIVPEFLIAMIGLVLSLPAALLCILPAMGSPRAEDGVIASISIAANAPIWGYGLAWLMSLISRRL